MGMWTVAKEHVLQDSPVSGGTWSLLLSCIRQVMLPLSYCCGRLYYRRQHVQAGVRLSSPERALIPCRQATSLSCPKLPSDWPPSWAWCTMVNNALYFVVHFVHSFHEKKRKKYATLSESESDGSCMVTVQVEVLVELYATRREASGGPSKYEALLLLESAKCVPYQCSIIPLSKLVLTILCCAPMCSHIPLPKHFL